MASSSELQGDRSMTPLPDTLPFALPERFPTRRIRASGANAGPPTRRQPMAGFEDRFTDIVDYIVRITDEIWIDRAVGYIHETYAADCVVYTSYGIVRTARQVTANTVAAIVSAPDGETTHLAVAWSGNEDEGFYTAHLGYDIVTNNAATVYGPATGRRYEMRFAADCISHANKIHTEWLVRDNGAVVRQLGYDLDEAARAVAERAIVEPYVPRIEDQPAAAPGSVEAWARALFDTAWNGRRLDRLGEFYAADVAVHSGGGREVAGVRALADLILSIIASVPDGVVQVEHVCWTAEADGVIVAVRWLLSGSSARGGLLGDALPSGRPVYMMGASHFRLEGARIVEEWTVFDEVAVLAMAYRQ
jgi:predicted ester cyclase